MKPEAGRPAAAGANAGELTGTGDAVGAAGLATGGADVAASGKPAGSGAAATGKPAGGGAITRRAFVGFACATAACAAVGGAGVAFAGDGGLLRPPGGQDEAAFRAACLKCDRCRSACPTGAVSVASVSDGFLGSRTPKLNFHRGYCDFCGKCQEVCATGALGAFDPCTDKLGVAIVQRDRCLAFSQGCETCKDSCAFGALTFDSARRPVVNADLCNGCGACECACTALVYGAFAGGTRRGMVVVDMAAYESLGATVVDGWGA